MLVCGVALAYYNNQKEYLNERLILYQRNVATKSVSNKEKCVKIA